MNILTLFRRTCECLYVCLFVCGWSDGAM